MEKGLLCAGKRHPAGMYAPAGLIVVGCVVWIAGALTVGVDLVLHIMAMAAVLVGSIGVVSVLMDIAGFSMDIYPDRIIIKRGALLARSTTEIAPRNIAEVVVERSWLTRLVAPSAGIITLSLNDGRSGDLPLMSNAAQVAKTIRGIAGGPPAGKDQHGQDY